MKPALFLTISFLLFASSRQSREQVADTSGKPIFPGSRFYIRPNFIVRYGGGLTAAKTGDSTCPVTVLEDFSDLVDGLKVRFIIPGISPGIIFTGTPIDIAFEEKPDECVSLPKWVVVADDYPRKWVGVGNATQDHPGKQIITGSGNFNIQDGGVFRYYIVFCHDFRVPSTCFNVTRLRDKKGWRLVLTNGKPFFVEFVDATPR